MSNTHSPKLPPMTALEFVIANTFRHFLFGVWLTTLWVILLLPFLAAVYFTAFRSGIPDFKALTPAALAAFAALGVMALLATFSIAVNWHRRVLLNERPRRLGWVSLNGVVWKYFFGFLLALAAVGILVAAAAASIQFLPESLSLRSGVFVSSVSSEANFEIVGYKYAISALLGLSALFTWYRLSSWLPALATGDKDYTLGVAWRTTRNNRLRFLGFTFWLLFSLAITGGIGAGAFFGQQAINNPYATAAAFAVMGLLVWLALFFTTTIATSHYSLFSQRGEKPE